MTILEQMEDQEIFNIYLSGTGFTIANDNGDIFLTRDELIRLGYELIHKAMETK